MPNEKQVVCTADHNIAAIPQAPVLAPPGSSVTLIPQFWTGCVECGKTLDEIRKDLTAVPKRTRSPRKPKSADTQSATSEAAA